MATALVTGASSGIGLELSRLLARDRHDLVLVARNRERLETVARGLAQEYGVRAEAWPADLSQESAPSALVRGLDERGVAVDVLVNNAGFGAHGRFEEVALDVQLEMIRVNVSAPTELAHRLLPAMLHRRSGRILNVASMAAFQAGPLMAVYYATKACLLSLSEALANETAGTGVTVTALCPGPVPTEFQKRAGVRRRSFQGPLVVSAAEAARAGYEGMRRGQRIVVPGVANRLVVQALRLTPRRLAAAGARRIQERRR